jgi:uncharacterized protein YbbC (DUF1343 family)
LAAAINRAKPPGVKVVPVRFTPKSSKFVNEECRGIHFIVTDWDKFRSFDLGLTVALALRTSQGSRWEPEKWKRLLGNEDVYRRVMAGEKADAILKSVEADLASYRELKKDVELYR